jgi:hypothetical protein
VFHPANVKPVRVNEFDVSAVAELAVCADIEPVPPFASKVAVKPPAVHCAYSVADAENGKLAPSAYAVPPMPLATVFQPANVKPVRVNEFDVSAVAELADCADIEPVPRFALKVTVGT